MKEAKKKTGKIACITAAVLALTAVILYYADGREACMELYGGKTVQQQFGTEYSDPGCTAFSRGKIFGRGRELPVETEGSVDITHEGSYSISYRTSFRGKEYTAERTVNVKDTLPPEISFKHRSGYDPGWFEGYEEEGCSAFDLKDGDLTDMVEREYDSGRLVYTVTDSSGNTARTERSCRFNDTAPHIELSGDEETEITACPFYDLPPVRAYDDLGNDLTDKIITEGSLKPYLPGEYEIKYYMENADGNRVEAKRTVKVLPAAVPETAEPEEKTIFLTFDDGPGPFTEELLDVLDKYGVKATFFVTCAKPEYADMIGRACREGHSIGAHSAIHKYNIIYNSEQEYFTDLEKVERLIAEQTGQYSPLVRFPGGSKTLRGLNRPLFAFVDECIDAMGFRYFDWNVTSSDAGNAVCDMQKINDNVIYGCADRDWSVVLQHDTNGCSVGTVEGIIKWGLENGYSFRALDLSVPEVHSVNPEKYS